MIRFIACQKQAILILFYKIVFRYLIIIFFHCYFKELIFYYLKYNTWCNFQVKTVVVCKPICSVKLLVAGFVYNIINIICLKLTDSATIYKHTRFRRNVIDINVQQRRPSSLSKFIIQKTTPADWQLSQHVYVHWITVQRFQYHPTFCIAF